MDIRKYPTLLPAAALPAAPADAQQSHAQPDDTRINIDDDFTEVASIEAGGVDVDDIQTCFYSSAVDEEDLFVTATTIADRRSGARFHPREGRPFRG